MDTEQIKAAKTIQGASPNICPALAMSWQADKTTVVDAAILFTDLNGSSALYRQIGDIGAYRVIRRHFDLLATVIADYQGVLVKTIGDAVMAVFSTRRMAVRAALAIQACIGAFNKESLGNGRM